VGPLFHPRIMSVPTDQSKTAVHASLTVPSFRPHRPIEDARSTRLSRSHHPVASVGVELRSSADPPTTTTAGEALAR